LEPLRPHGAPHRPVADAIGIRETLAFQGIAVIVTVALLQLWRQRSASEDRERTVLAESLPLDVERGPVLAPADGLPSNIPADAPAR
jgi:hypothetical protein